MNAIFPAQEEFNEWHTFRQRLLQRYTQPKAVLDSNDKVGKLVSEADGVLKKVAVNRTRYKAEWTQTLTTTCTSQNFVDQELRGSGSIYFPGECFVEGQYIPLNQLKDLACKNVLVKKAVSIDRYFRSEIGRRFNFKENGFNFISFDQKLKEDLGAFADMLYSHDRQVLKETIFEEFRLFLTDWGKKQGIEFDIVVPFKNLLYRHTEIGNAGAKPIGIAHIDYCNEDFGNVLNKFGWYMEDALRSIDSSICLTDLEVSEVVNVWAPLNKRPALNTLSVMCMDTIKDCSEELRKICFNIDERHYSVNPKPYHKWVAQEDMQCGDGVVFRSYGTLHASTTLKKAIECDAFRHSIEGRFVLCKLKKKI